MFEKLFQKPLGLSALGWASFIVMYGLVLGLSQQGLLEVTPAFYLTAPLSLLALICWVVAVYKGVGLLRSPKQKLYGLVVVVTSITPLVVLFYVLWMLIHGF